MPVVFPKAFHRRTIRPPIEKMEADSDASTIPPQASAAHADLLTRYKMLRRDILAASANLPLSPLPSVPRGCNDAVVSSEGY